MSHGSCKQLALLSLLQVRQAGSPGRHFTMERTLQDSREALEEAASTIRAHGPGRDLFAKQREPLHPRLGLQRYSCRPVLKASLS